MYTYVYLLK